MNKYIGYIFSIMVFGGNFVQASEVVCTPAKGSDSRWKQATISDLEDSLLGLQKIKVTGGFLAADLICQTACVGFLNGAEVKGNLQLDSIGQVTSVSIETQPGDVIQSVTFSCK